MDNDHLPNLDDQLVELPRLGHLGSELTLSHPPSILLLRERQDYLVDRYSGRKESAETLSRRVNQRVL